MMNPFSRALSAKHAQQGFTLIELMVALVIGLVVVLGAGKLFLVGLQGFREVEALGRKQETINFSANTLVRDIRRASDVSIASTSEEEKVIKVIEFIEVAFINNGEVAGNGCVEGDLAYHAYQLGGFVEKEGYSLSMGVSCIPGIEDDHFEPLVAGFSRDGFLYNDRASGDGAWKIGLVLCRLDEVGKLNCDPPEEGEEAESIWFYAVNRTKSISKGSP